MAVDFQRGETQGVGLREWLDSVRPPYPSEIAKRAGVSRQYVANVMSKRSKPSQKLRDACRSLGLPVNEIFGGPHYIDQNDGDDG